MQGLGFSVSSEVFPYTLLAICQKRPQFVSIFLHVVRRMFSDSAISGIKREVEKDEEESNNLKQYYIIQH